MPQSQHKALQAAISKAFPSDDAQIVLYHLFFADSTKTMDEKIEIVKEIFLKTVDDTQANRSDQPSHQLSSLATCTDFLCVMVFLIKCGVKFPNAVKLKSLAVKEITDQQILDWKRNAQNNQELQKKNTQGYLGQPSFTVGLNFGGVGESAHYDYSVDGWGSYCEFLQVCLGYYGLPKLHKVVAIPMNDCSDPILIHYLLFPPVHVTLLVSFPKDVVDKYTKTISILTQSITHTILEEFNLINNNCTNAALGVLQKFAALKLLENKNKLIDWSLLSGARKWLEGCTMSKVESTAIEAAKRAVKRFKFCQCLLMLITLLTSYKQSLGNSQKIEKLSTIINAIKQEVSNYPGIRKHSKAFETLKRDIMKVLSTRDSIFEELFSLVVQCLRAFAAFLGFTYMMPPPPERLQIKTFVHRVCDFFAAGCDGIQYAKHPPIYSDSPRN